MPAPWALNLDTIGGVTITTAGSLTVLVTALKVVLHGDSLPSHGIGPHAAPTAQANPLQTVLVEGRQVVRVGVDPASCGDVISAAGPVTLRPISGP